MTSSATIIAILIIRDTFWPILDPPLIYVSFGDTGMDPPPSRDVTFFIFQNKNFFEAINTSNRWLLYKKGLKIVTWHFGRPLLATREQLVQFLKLNDCHVSFI